MSAGITPLRPPFAEWLSTTNDITRIFLSAGHLADLINMAGGLPEPDTFPVPEIAAIARDVIAAHPRAVLG